MRVKCACECVRGGERMGGGGRGWKGKGRRERKIFKDQVTPMGAIFSFPVTFCSLTEETETDGGTWLVEGWPSRWGKLEREG